MGCSCGFLKFLCCLVFVEIILIWRLNTNLFSDKEQNVAFEQLVLTKQHNRTDNQTMRWVIIYWSTWFGQPKHLQLKWEKNRCPVACEVTSNHSREREASGFIVHARDGHMIPPSDAVPWILWTQENPVYTPVLKNETFMSKFKLLASYRLDSDFPVPTFSAPKLTAPIPFKNKTGFIMVALSNCEPVRTEYMRQLMRFVRVDSFGRCLKNRKGLIPWGAFNSSKGKNFKELKTELAKTYKFTLVFFNQDCDYFVDEQLSHALDAGSVPVVMSTDKLDEFLPGNLKTAVIKVRDFKSPRRLAEYLKHLNENETAYNKYLEWKGLGIGNLSGTIIGNFWNSAYPIYCQICVALSEGRLHKDGLKKDNCKPRTFEDWGLAKVKLTARNIHTKSISHILA